MDVLIVRRESMCPAKINRSCFTHVAPVMKYLVYSSRAVTVRRHDPRHRGIGNDRQAQNCQWILNPSWLKRVCGTSYLDRYVCRSISPIIWQYYFILETYYVYLNFCRFIYMKWNHDAIFIMNDNFYAGHSRTSGCRRKHKWYSGLITSGAITMLFISMEPFLFAEMKQQFYVHYLMNNAHGEWNKNGSTQDVIYTHWIIFHGTDLCTTVITEIPILLNTNKTATVSVSRLESFVQMWTIETVSKIKIR